MSALGTWLQRATHTARRVLPEGKELPEDEWRARHRAILYIIWAHAIGIFAFGIAMNADPRLVFAESALVALIGGVAAWTAPKRRFRGAVAGLALVTSSAAIVQFSGGYIEAHFHFFVVLAVIALYQDWAPFLLAIAYVAVDHGVVGAIWPEIVYNHADAYAHPWKWALIHAALVLGESAALLMGWKIAENARRRTALVLDSAGEGIFGLDLDGKITFANPAAAAMTQRSADSLLGARIDTFLRDVDASAHANDSWIPREARERAGAHTAMQVERPDRTSILVEWEQTPILNNDVMIGTVLTLKDVTERTRAEETLRRAVSTLTATLESTTDGILVIDQARRIAGFNRKFVEMWNIPMAVLESADDARALEYVQTQLTDPQGFLTKVRDLYAHPEATSFDEIAFKDGRIIERYSQPQRLGDVVIGRVWSFRDVTERRKAEQALREQQDLQAANARLRELDRLKTQFINNAAHELGTPLTPIKLQAHMLRSETLGPLSDRQKNSVTVLARNVDQLGLLLRDVLDSARVQAGRLELKLSPIVLDRVLSESVESFAEAARQQGVELLYDGEKDIVVEAEGRRITQVMFNLLRNALKYTNEGGRIQVRLLRRGARAVVEVEDTGCGIDPSDLARLFKPFSQIEDAMERTNAGAGLGLYISQGILESHGGTIECHSEGIGSGTTFRFTLPIPTAPSAMA